MTLHTRKSLAPAIALGLLASLGACSAIPTNTSLDSVHQPVVERVNYTLDLTSGSGGLSIPEQRRLAGWFEAMGLRYGDRIAVDDPLSSPATRAAVAALAEKHGLLLADGAPVTPGYVDPGKVRVVVSRSYAHVPGCPDWGDKTSANPNNATYSGFGCAVNGNLAAMVADPEHLVRGARGTGETVVMSSNKAIGSYRKAPPTGEKGLKKNETSKEGN